MTLDEAKKIAIILGTADGGCQDCVRNMVYIARIQFPEFSWESTGLMKLYDPVTSSLHERNRTEELTQAEWDARSDWIEAIEVLVSEKPNT